MRFELLNLDRVRFTLSRKPVKRFDVYLISLDPTKGSEIKKTRPCLIISPNEMNRHIRTVIIAPMTSTIKNYPSRVTTTFQKKRGQIVLDQIRTVDKQRLIKKLGTISSSAQDKTLNTLQEIFAP
ncbi:type II toxin-antitoxin system PemK/MazF family toxin [Halalkalibaculum sp. DA384]|uniref:type II toxin-antitoxin system PemK/MazF family toxin n=1 Tax=Halalkalibaculum sp. DA384 TaxID=3373606 RepID=UPI0037547A92